MSDSDAPIDDVLSRLSSFSREQLEQIESKIRFLKSGNANPAPEISSDAELMLIAITDYYSSHGLEHTQPGALRKVSSFASFKTKVESVTQYLAKASAPLNRIERLAMFRVAIELLYANMVEMSVPVSTRTIMNHVHRIPSVLNRAFPGYAKMAVLHIVVRKPTKGNSNGQPAHH